MIKVSAYRRPATVQDALALLPRSGTVLIGGGTKLNAAPDGGPMEIHDLQVVAAA